MSNTRRIKRAISLNMVLLALLGIWTWMSFLRAVFGVSPLAPIFEWFVIPIDWLIAVAHIPFDALVARINRNYGLSLELNELWFRLFVAQAVLVISVGGEVFGGGKKAGALKASSITSTFILAAAMLVGFLPTNGGWIVHGAMAMLPIVALFLAQILLVWIVDAPQSWKKETYQAFRLSILILGGIAFLAGALFRSITPWPGAGLAALLVGTLFVGFSMVFISLRNISESDENVRLLRAGLKVLLPPAFSLLSIVATWSYFWLVT